MTNAKSKTDAHGKADAHEDAVGHATTDHNPKTDPAPNSNTVKDPHDWTTGGEPMTGAQASYLKTLSEQTHTEFDETLTKGEASMRIDELRSETGLAGKK